MVSFLVQLELSDWNTFRFAFNKSESCTASKNPGFNMMHPLKSSKTFGFQFGWLKTRLGHPLELGRWYSFRYPQDLTIDDLSALMVPPGEERHFSADINQEERFWYCWWFRNLANQFRLVVYPIIYKVFYIHSRWWRVSAINSTTDGNSFHAFNIFQ